MVNKEEKNVENIVIFGAGGFGREIQWLIERINEQNDRWKILGYIDDGVEAGVEIDEYKVIGNTEYLLARQEKLAVAVAVGNSNVRKKITQKLEENENIFFPNLIDPSVLKSKKVFMGKGNLVCAGTIATVDITMGDYNIINLDCTIGHDVQMGSLITVYPSVNISGCTTIGDVTEIGTGTQIIQGKQIASSVVIGAGSVVVKDIGESGTYVGVPVKRIK